MELVSFRGTLSLTGQELRNHVERLYISRKCETDTPHITVLTKHEVQKLHLDLNIEQAAKISQESLQILSVGQVKDVEFLTVSWPHAQLYRKKLGLQPKDFHLTLTKTNNHDITKDLTTTKGGYPAFLKIFQELPEEGKSTFGLWKCLTDSETT
jgi:atypical dual specificity phosphatase